MRSMSAIIARLPLGLWEQDHIYNLFQTLSAPSAMVVIPLYPEEALTGQ